MRKNLLFVTYHDKDCEEGLSYAIDLAKIMNKGMTVLLICRRNLMERFEDMMTSMTFAEAGEHEAAKKIYAGDDINKDRRGNGIGFFTEKCLRAGVEVRVQPSAIDIVPALKYCLSVEKTIDMVLLGPNVTDNGNMSEKELRKLVRTASRPIVTLARQTPPMFLA